MIIGNKNVNYTDNDNITYSIVDVFKNNNGTIGSYQVEIKRNHNLENEKYEVFLDEKEMLAVASNVAAAYEYIKQSTKGLYLFDVFMGGYDHEYVKKFLDITKNTIDSTSVEFYIIYIEPVTIEDYCTGCYPIGLNVQPRYQLYDEYYGKYSDNVSEGTLVDPNLISGLDEFEIAINGSIWIDGKTRDAQSRIDDNDFVQLIIKDDESYEKSLPKCRHLFKERLKTLKADEDAKKEKAHEKKEI